MTPAAKTACRRVQPSWDGGRPASLVEKINSARWKDNMKKLTIIALFLFAAALTSVRAADAKENWDKSCKKCHGADGKGDTTMGKKLSIRDYTDAKVQASFKDEEAIKAIKE